MWTKFFGMSHLHRARFILHIIYTYLLPFLLTLSFIPIPLVWKTPNKESEATYIILLTTSLWVSQCIPVEVTSLIFIFAVPLLGIADSGVISSVYLDDTIVFYFGVCVFSIAIEYSELHLRIAFTILYRHSRGLSSLLFGSMLTTGILSMLVDNTLCASMMIPIVVAVLDEMESGTILNPSGEHFPKSVMTLYAAKEDIIDTESTFATSSGGGVSAFAHLQNKEEVPPMDDSGELVIAEFSRPTVATSVSSSSYSKSGMSTAPKSYPGSRMGKESLEKLDHSLQKAYQIRALFLIATAYAANIGGTALLISSSTNMVAVYVVARARDIIAHAPMSVRDSTECLKILNVDKFTWFEFNIITSILTFLCGFLFFNIVLVFWIKKRKLENYKKSIALTQETLRKKLELLGPMSFQHYTICVLVTIWILLLLLRSPHHFPGWSELLSLTWVSGSTPTLLLMLFFFIVPKNIEFFREMKTRGFWQGSVNTLNDTLVMWNYIRLKVPWKTLLLLGGGNALLATTHLSHLRSLLIRELTKSDIGTLPHFVLLTLLSFAVAALTTFVNNTTACVLIVPVVLEMAFASGAHPLYFVLPTSTICSYAFLFTVSTPSNAIFASINSVKQIDVFKSGCCLLFMSLVILFIVTHTFGELIFAFRNYNGACNYLR